MPSKEHLKKKMKLQDIRCKLNQQKGQRLQIEKNLTEFKTSLKEGERSLHRHEKAREIVREVGIKTQQQLQYHISDITSLALEAVFDNPYQLKVEFIQRRNKTECDLKFVRGDLEIDPIEASGVGAIDVASFALRIASWSMLRPKTRNTIILDEPFKHLSLNLRNRASSMIKEISDKMGIQFIIVSHDPELADFADRIFEVGISKGISHVS